ncbi:MAG: hypothetical protein ACQEVA_10125 [Myxococcota bacterium]
MRSALIQSRARPATTVLLCSHRLEEVRHLIDRIVALEDGRVVAFDTTETFVADMGRAAIDLARAVMDSLSDELEDLVVEGVHDLQVDLREERRAS